MTFCIGLEVTHKDEHFAKKKKKKINFDKNIRKFILETVTEKGNPSAKYRKLKEDI